MSGRHCFPEFSDVLEWGGCSYSPESGFSIFMETGFLHEEQLMLLLIHAVNRHHGVIMQKAWVLVDGFSHDKYIALRGLLMTDHPVPSNPDPYYHLC